MGGGRVDHIWCMGVVGHSYDGWVVAGIAVVGGMHEGQSWETLKSSAM